MGIPMLRESLNGHDTLDVPKKDIEEKVKTELKDGKWVTLEKEDGTSEVLTKKDLPEEEPKKPAAGDWNKVFSAKKTTEITPAVTTNKPVIPQTTKSSSTTNFSKKFEKVKSATSTKTVKGG